MSSERQPTSKQRLKYPMTAWVWLAMCGGSKSTYTAHRKAVDMLLPLPLHQYCQELSCAALTTKHTRKHYQSYFDCQSPTLSTHRRPSDWLLRRICSALGQDINDPSWEIAAPTWARVAVGGSCLATGLGIAVVLNQVGWP